MEQPPHWHWDHLSLFLYSPLPSFVYVFIITQILWWLGFPGGSSGKEPTCQCRGHKRHRFDPLVGKIPQKRAEQPTPVFLPRESHRQRRLAGYNPEDCKESDTTEAIWHAHMMAMAALYLHNFGRNRGEKISFLFISEKKNKTKQNRIESYWLLLARLFYVPVPKPIADSCSQSEVFHSRSSDAGVSATWVNSGTGSLPKLLPDQD